MQKTYYYRTPDRQLGKFRPGISGRQAEAELRRLGLRLSRTRLPVCLDNSIILYVEAAPALH